MKLFVSDLFGQAIKAAAIGAALLLSMSASQAQSGPFAGFDGTWSGNAVSDMLLGVPRQTTFTPSTANLLAKQRGNHYFMFFNDDWKMTRNLTLNLGFRWEITDFVEENRAAFR